MFTKRIIDTDHKERKYRFPYRLVPPGTDLTWTTGEQPENMDPVPGVDHNYDPFGVHLRLHSILKELPHGIGADVHEITLYTSFMVIRLETGPTDMRNWDRIESILNDTFCLEVR